MNILSKKILLHLLAFLLPLAFSCQSNEPAVPAEKKREMATLLFNQELYEQAVDEYKEYLSQYNPDIQEQANIAYQVANIYMERLRDYESALAWFLRSKTLNPQSNVQEQISKKVVECLERLNRSRDARQVITQNAALDDAQKIVSRPGEVVAKIGDREITTGDLEYRLEQLPDFVKPQMQSADARKEFLRQYVAQEVLYSSALRHGLDNDKEVLNGLFEAKKGLMVEKLLKDEIGEEAGLENYQNADVETFFNANKERYAERDENGKVTRQLSFPEVARQVAADFRQEKQQQAYQRIVERLMKAENVTIYDDKVK